MKLERYTLHVHQLSGNQGLYDNVKQRYVTQEEFETIEKELRVEAEQNHTPIDVRSLIDKENQNTVEERDLANRILIKSLSRSSWRTFNNAGGEEHTEKSKRHAIIDAMIEFRNL